MPSSVRPAVATQVMEHEHKQVCTLESFVVDVFEAELSRDIEAARFSFPRHGPCGIYSQACPLKAPRSTDVYETLFNVPHVPSGLEFVAGLMQSCSYNRKRYGRGKPPAIKCFEIYRSAVTQHD